MRNEYILHTSRPKLERYLYTMLRNQNSSQIFLIFLFTFYHKNPNTLSTSPLPSNFLSQSHGSIYRCAISYMPADTSFVKHSFAAEPGPLSQVWITGLSQAMMLFLLTFGILPSQTNAFCLGFLLWIWIVPLRISNGFNLPIAIQQLLQYTVA